MATSTVLITGATGHVGGALLDTLVADGGFDVVALTHRSPVADSRTDGRARVRWVRGDLADPADVAGAARGCDAAFLVWPFGTAEGSAPVLDALCDAVGHVVYLSTAAVRDDLNGGDNAITGFHTAIERGLAARAVRTTMLRSSGMATNALAWADQIRAGRRVRWVFGELARPLVHEADLADVARLALRDDPRVAGGAHRLTGPARVTQAVQVETIGEALGRSLRWEEAPPDEVHAQLVRTGWPPAAADGAMTAWAKMLTHPEAVQDVSRFTGTPGRTFARWARDHVDEFR